MGPWPSPRALLLFPPAPTRPGGLALSPAHAIPYRANGRPPPPPDYRRPNSTFPSRPAPAKETAVCAPPAQFALPRGWAPAAPPLARGLALPYSVVEWGSVEDPCRLARLCSFVLYRSRAVYVLVLVPITYSVHIDRKLPSTYLPTE